MASRPEWGSALMPQACLEKPQQHCSARKWCAEVTFFLPWP